MPTTDDDDIIIQHRLNPNGKFEITKELALIIAPYCESSPVSGIATFGQNLAALANLP